MTLVRQAGVDGPRGARRVRGVRQGGGAKMEPVAAVLQVQDHRRVHAGGPRRVGRVGTRPQGQAALPVPQPGLPRAQVQPARSGEFMDVFPFWCVKWSTR